MRETFISGLYRILIIGHLFIGELFVFDFGFLLGSTNQGKFMLMPPKQIEHYLHTLKLSIHFPY